jgi:CRP-like cAMP-binding protein
MRDNAFFTGLDAAALARVVPVFRVTTLPAGAELYERGRIAQRVYLVLRGSVAAVQRTGPVQTTVAVLGPGEFTGERALLQPPEPHVWTAVCLEETRVAYAEGDALLAALTTLPAIAVNVARALHRRVRDAACAIDGLIAGA